MVKVIVRPGQVAYYNNVRWREGEVVDVAESDLKDKKPPKWGVVAGTAEAKAIAEKIKERAKDRGIKSYAPSALIQKNTPIAE